MGVTVGIHQPGYLPWLGFFKKLQQCDKFVFYDDVDINKKDFHNRNKIRTGNGSTNLTVPIIASQGTKINEVKIDNTKNWASKHQKTICYSYVKSNYFKEFKEELDSIYNKKFERLVDLNVEIIKFLMKKFGIKTELYFSSELNIDGRGSKRILEICKSLEAKTYISGIVWAKDNLLVDDFTNNGIEIKFQKFVSPKYNQCYQPFLENMSAIDLLFNEGENSGKILENTKVEEILENYQVNLLKK